MNITGEYWLIGGEAEYADGDNGDKNHEKFAYEHLAYEYLEKIYNLAKTLTDKLPSLSSIEFDSEELANHVHDLIALINKSLSNVEISKKLNLDIETVDVLINYMNGKTDIRVYMMKRYDWIVVRNNNIELYGLNQHKINNLIEGLDGVIEQEGGEDINDEDVEFNLFDFKNNKSIDLTLKDIKENRLFKPQTLPQTKYNTVPPAVIGKQYGRELWRNTSESFKVWLEETIPVGQCFKWATQTGIDKFIDGTLVHGFVITKDHTKPFYHAWIEHNGHAYDWQMQIENWEKIKDGFYSMPIEDFKEKYYIIKEKRYKPARALGFMHKEKHYGPWEI